jgi:hypothetical protein
VQYLPVKSVSFASQVRRGNYKNSNIAKTAGKFGRSFLAKLANFPRFLPATQKKLDRYLVTVADIEAITGERLPVADYVKHDKLSASWLIPHGCNKG